MICLDYGHGGKDTGAVFCGRKESKDALELGKKIRDNLIKSGLEVDETRSDDSFLNLYDRVRKCNSKEYDFVISIHRNAYIYNQASGVEVYLNPVYKKDSQDLAFKLVNNLAKLGFRNRGIKKNNFYMLRNTKSKALLIEVGFIDSEYDNHLFDSKRDRIADTISACIVSKLRK